MIPVTLGRLYYVEDDVNFQACMSTGWEIVEIGGSNGNLALNQAPSVESNFWGLDDDQFMLLIQQEML